LAASVDRNIFIISIDSLRFDCCASTGAKGWLEREQLLDRLITPTLDQVAKRSLHFTEAFSTATYTTAAHASLFTGLYPPRHGVRSFFGHRLPSQVVTLAELLGDSSYQTFFMSDNPTLFEVTGLSRGFSVKVDNEDELIDRLLAANRSGPFLAFAHFFDVHDPYLFSPRYAAGRENDDYFTRLAQECRRQGIGFSRRDHSRAYYELFYALSGRRSYFFPWYIDGINKFAQGRFARFYHRLDKELQAFDSSIVVVLSDHGEGRVNDRNPEKFRHEGLLYDDVVRILLLISDPGSPAGVCEDLVSIADILPTVVAGAGLENKLERLGQEIDGICVPRERHRSVYAETWQRREGSLFSSFDNESFLRQRAVRFGNERVVLNGKPEIFMRPAGDSADLQTMVSRHLLCSFAKVEVTAGGQDSLPPEDESWRADEVVQLFDLTGDPFEEEPMGLSQLDSSRAIRVLEGLGYLGAIEEKAVQPQEIGLFRTLARRIDGILERLDGRPVGIYGAGEHTRMLFEKTAIRAANIVALVDSDEAKWGCEVAGFKVAAPDSLARASLAGVIVSSRAFEREIYEALVRKLGISPDHVFRLYSEDDAKRGYLEDEEVVVTKQLKELGYL